MSTLPKTPVEIIQELIAVHTTRKEVTEKMKIKGQPNEFENVLRSAEKQSDEFINELLSELSNYGDSDRAVVERDDDYHKTWKEALKGNDFTSIEDNKKIFLALEECLKKIYKDILDVQDDLPPTVAGIVNRQLAAIQKDASAIV